jgi:YesN/AraC family two-component response regulator
MIVDDQKLIREGLKTLLELKKDFKVVGESKNGKEATEDFRKLEPDIVLMDIRMPEINGVQATRIINANFENPKIIILTTFDNDEHVFEGIKSRRSQLSVKGRIKQKTRRSNKNCLQRQSTY